MLLNRSSVSFVISVVKTLVAPLLIASCCSAEETTIIATGLDRPTAVAVVGEQVFYVDASGLHSLEGTQTDGPIGVIHSLASFGNERLIVSADEVGLWSVTGTPPRLKLKQSVQVVDEADSEPFAALTIDERHTFALREGNIYRSRRAGKGLTSLRAFGTTWANDIAALALSERGYLVLLQADEGTDAWRLVFCDPHTPEGEPLAAWKVPLTEPISLAYSPLPSPTERRLYALTSDGLYRLDAAIGESISTTKIATIPHPVAMAFAPDGTLNVTALTDDETGVLLRLNTPL